MLSIVKIVDMTLTGIQVSLYRLLNSRGKSLLNIVSVGKNCKMEKIALKERCCRYSYSLLMHIERIFG